MHVDDELINQIARKVKQCEIVFFIGAGVSKAVDPQYLTGQELKNVLLDELPENTLSDLSLHEVAELFKDRFSKAELTRLISQKVNHVETDSLLHKILAIFPSDIITTNYDTLIEVNILKLFPHDNINVIIDDTDIVFTKPGKTVFKMHGSFSGRHNDIVITKSDYDKFRKDNKLKEAYLKVLLSRSVVFLGYSMGDANVMRIFDKNNQYLKDNASQCYFITPYPETSKCIIPHIIVSDILLFMRKLFYKVYFNTQYPRTPVASVSAVLGLNEQDINVYINSVVEHLKRDQFLSGLWGKSIKQLFAKCFNQKQVPKEYMNFGSFSATDIVLRDLSTVSSLEQSWDTENILASIKSKSDIFGGVGLNERIDINKFSSGQLKIDSNIRHTCAVINIYLLLGKFSEALTSLKWICQFENFWVDPNDGKMPINLACIIDCIDNAQENAVFAEFCFYHPDEFKFVKDIFIKWGEKRNSLYKVLNNSLCRDDNLWALRNNSGVTIEGTKVYITLFILLRLTNFPKLFPRLFSRIVLEIVNAFKDKPGISLSLKNTDLTDIGATGTFLRIVYNDKAFEILKSELDVSKYLMIACWCEDSCLYLHKNITKKSALRASFSEIVSPIIQLLLRSK